MKVIAYSIKTCEKELLIKANQKQHDITMISNRLSLETVGYAAGKDAVLVFSCDDVSAPVLTELNRSGIRYLVTRSAGTDHIDLKKAAALGIKVASIPGYSPESIAEHAMTLILALYRNILPAHEQMLEYNFSLDNLAGNTVRGKTVGIIGYGNTGRALGGILQGFGAHVLVHDQADVSAACQTTGAKQVALKQLLKEADIISLHVPLNEHTRHMINAGVIRQMKKGVILINVSRGAVIHSEDVYHALQQHQIEKLGMDVYEFEHDVFFFDHSRSPVNDRLLKAFIQHSRVILTPHMAFLTHEALQVIAGQTIAHLNTWENKKCIGAACHCIHS